MKRMPLLAWSALLALLIASVATFTVESWLWSLEGVRGLQAFGGWLKLPMQIFTFLGDEQFYLAIIPLVYWCVHKELGADLGVLLVVSSLTNGMLKSLIKHNRPFWEAANLQLSDATSFSTPSGHAQTSAALFGEVIAFLSGSGLGVLWGALFGLLILLVAVSRVYLGVHFPGDVLWGIAIGLGLVALYNWLKPKLLPSLKRLPLSLHVILALATAAVILGGGSLLLVVPFGTGQNFPGLFLAAWGASVEDASTVGGLVAGLWIGLTVESRYVRFTVAGPWWQRVLRYVLGAAVLVAIWTGLKVVFPAEPLMLGLGLRMVRYALAMLWAIVVWPWLFVRIGLAQREPIVGAPGPSEHPEPSMPRPTGA